MRRYFWGANTGLQNQDVQYTSLSLQAGSNTSWLDPNTLSTDGTVALGDYDFTKDGSLVAYQIGRFDPFESGCIELYCILLTSTD